MNDGCDKCGWSAKRFQEFKDRARNAEERLSRVRETLKELKRERKYVEKNVDTPEYLAGLQFAIDKLKKVL